MRAGGASGGGGGLSPSQIKLATFPCPGYAYQYVWQMFQSHTTGSVM
jgi:hypothetical protein